MSLPLATFIAELRRRRVFRVAARPAILEKRLSGDMP